MTYRYQTHWNIGPEMMARLKHLRAVWGMRSESEVVRKLLEIAFERPDVAADLGLEQRKPHTKL